MGVESANQSPRAAFLIPSTDDDCEVTAKFLRVDGFSLHPLGERSILRAVGFYGPCAARLSVFTSGTLKTPQPQPVPAGADTTFRCR